MALPAGMSGHLQRLADAAGGGSRLADDLEDLLGLATRAVPSSLAVSVTRARDRLQVTVTAADRSALLDPVRASLALRLPQRTAAASGQGSDGARDDGC